MLIVSMTLTGCSFDLGAIVSGLQNVIGDIGGKIGGFIEKGLDFAKDFVGKAKDFIGPIVDAGKEIFEDFAPIAENITNAVDTVDGGLDSVGNVGDAVTGFADAISGTGKDSAGEDLDEEAPVNEVVPDPDNEDAVIEINPDEDEDSATETADEEVTDTEDLQEQSQALKDGAEETLTAVSALGDQISGFDMSDDDKDALKERLNRIKDNIKIIISDPTSKASKALFEQTKNDVNSVVEDAKKFGDLAKATVDSLEEVFDQTKDMFDSFNDAYSSIKNMFD
jgi:gas vesicle protein